MMQMAEALASAKESGQLKGRRDIVFAAWSGEEKSDCLDRVITSRRWKLCFRSMLPDSKRHRLTLLRHQITPQKPTRRRYHQRIHRQVKRAMLVRQTIRQLVSMTLRKQRVLLT